MPITAFTDTIHTPIGKLAIYASDIGVYFLKFTDTEKSQRVFEQVQKTHNMRVHNTSNPHTAQAKQELAEYFAGTRTHFQTPLHIMGTDFQQAAWQQLQTIPYGATISYAAQAQHMQCAKAVRAVANANGCNRISIIIPCHRVIGSNGTLTGYGGGLERKQWLLDFEASHTNT